MFASQLKEETGVDITGSKRHKTGNTVIETDINWSKPI
jgi:hypothetical protein